MAINRRQFIKRSAGAVTVSLLMPKLWLGQASGQQIDAAGRKIFVVVQLSGGNDGLNTVVPYTDSNYYTLRPTLGFKAEELKDAQGNSTILGNEPFGLHPALSEIKGLYDAGKVAVVLGVGYTNSNLSHFLSTDIWMTGDIVGGAGRGWLGKYADQKLVGQSSLSAVNIGGSLSKAFFADNVVVPSISNFNTYTFQTDNRFAGDRNNQINTFRQTSGRSFPSGSFAEALGKAGLEAQVGAAQLQTAISTYTSPVTYPSAGAGLSNRAVQFGNALKMAAQMITTVPEANLLMVQMGGFDNHSGQTGTAADSFTDKKTGEHAELLQALSLGVKAFYDDMAAHNLADNVVLMTFSEFGRRPNENASHGTDHGTSSCMFVIGNPVQGGRLYGEQPSLTNLDNARNLKFTVDFRSVYATILDKWLSADSQSILGGQFGNVGFLG